MLKQICKYVCWRCMARHLYSTFGTDLIVARHKQHGFRRFNTHNPIFFVIAVWIIIIIIIRNTRIISESSSHAIDEIFLFRYIHLVKQNQLKSLWRFTETQLHLNWCLPFEKQKYHITHIYQKKKKTVNELQTRYMLTKE